MRRIILAAGLAGCVLSCGRAVDLEGERAAVLRADKEWAAAAASGDVERTVSFWTDDAILFPPGARPLVGKEAIRKFVAESFGSPGFSVGWEPGQAVVAGSGDLAYTVGRNRFTARDAAGNVVTTTGNGVAIWRKERDGVWRCVIDIGTSDPAEAPAAGAAGPE